MTMQHYHYATLIGKNRVSSAAFHYGDYQTFETLVDGPDVDISVDEDGWDDRITGHRTFLQMCRFHEKEVKRLEELTGLVGCPERK